ncbi:MAG: hypothetical protein V4734_03305 [Terriglobus sp.]
MPVLLADGVKYVLSAGEKQATGVVMRALLPKSVLGGYAGTDHIPSSIWMVVGAMNFVTYVVCVMGFVVALGILADWVPQVQSLKATDSLLWRWPHGLKKALSYLVVCTLLFFVLFYCSFTVPDMLHSHSDVVSYVLLGTSEGAASLLFGWLLYPVVVARDQMKAQEASRWQFAFFLLVSFVLSSVLGGEMLHEAKRDEGLNLLLSQRVGWLIGLFLSLISAIPYAVSFVGMSLRSDHTEMVSSPVAGEDECFE